MRKLVLSAFDDFWLVLRYGFVGMLSVGLNIGLVYSFTEVVGLWYLESAILAFIITFVIAFLLQKHWTFRDGSGAYVRQGTSYLLIGLMNLVLDTTLLYVAVSVLGLWYLGAQAVIVVGLAFVSFIANRHITFAKLHPSELGVGDESDSGA